MLGDLKDKYAYLLVENLSLYINEFMAFGPKMYQLTCKDLYMGKVVCWHKTMKGISMKRNSNLFSIKSLPLYRNPVLAFCSILQYGSEHSYSNFHDVKLMMISLVHERQKKWDKRKGTIIPHQLKQGSLNINITFSQSLFKRKLTHIFMNEFIMSIPMKKEARVTQSKRYPKPGLKDDFGVTYPVSWR